MRAWVTAFLLLGGSSLMLLAAVAIVRFPDLYARMQASTKASTLGILFLALAAAVHFADLVVSAHATAIVVFVFLTAPVAAHVMGRAAYLVGVEVWDRTLFDDLETAARPTTEGGRRERRADDRGARQSAPRRET